MTVRNNERAVNNEQQRKEEELGSRSQVTSEGEGSPDQSYRKSGGS